MVIVANDLGYVDNSTPSATSIVQGRATSFNFNSLSIRFDIPPYDGGGTLAHEIGHATFGLYHPESSANPLTNPPVEDDKTLMYGVRNLRKDTKIRAVN